MAGILDIFANLFAKKVDESAFDAQRERLKRTKQAAEDVRVEEAAANKKLRDAIHAAGTATIAAQAAALPGHAKDRKTREEEISKMTGLSAPKDYAGPGTNKAQASESDNFKRWLGNG